MRRKRRGLRLNNKLRNKQDLSILKRIVFKLLKDMNICVNNLRNIKIRYAKYNELSPNCSASLLLKKYGNNEIIIKKNRKTYNVVGDISHEIGHEITMFGKFGLYGSTRRNIIGEISAYNFTIQFIKKFNEKMGTSLFFIKKWQNFSSSPTHCISRVLADIPLGSLIKNKYKNK